MDSEVWSFLLILFKRARRLCNSDTRTTEAELQVRAYRARAGLKTPKQTVTACSCCPAQPLRNSSRSTSSCTLGILLPGMPRACERRGQVRARPHVTPGQARRESGSLRLLARSAFPGCAVLNPRLPGNRSPRDRKCSRSRSSRSQLAFGTFVSSRGVPSRLAQLPPRG